MDKYILEFDFDECTLEIAVNIDTETDEDGSWAVITQCICDGADLMPIVDSNDEFRELIIDMANEQKALEGY